MTTNGLIRGRVSWFSDEKGFGFISPEHDCHCQHHTKRHHQPCKYCQHNHPADVYVHFSHIDSNDLKRRKLLGGQVVEFELIPCDHKKDQAGNVRVIR